MMKAQKEKKVLKSNLWIIWTVLCTVFAILLLFSLINLGIRYQAFVDQINIFKTTKIQDISENILQGAQLELVIQKLSLPETVFMFLSSSKEELLNGWRVKDGNTEIIVNISSIINNFKFSDINMNLGFLLMSVIFIFATFISGLPLLAKAGKAIAIKRAAKKELKKQKKLQLQAVTSQTQVGE